MILSDKDITRELAIGNLKIDPLDDPALQIQPASVDLRLSGTVIRENYPRQETFDIGEEIVLYPQEFILASVYEKVTIPDYLVAQIEGRSSIGRKGILVHATAGYIDPGFEGNITLEMFNLSRNRVTLVVGSRVAQLVIHRMSTPSARPYGKDRGSKYVGKDSEGTVPSKGA